MSYEKHCFFHGGLTNTLIRRRELCLKSLLIKDIADQKGRRQASAPPLFCNTIYDGAFSVSPQRRIAVSPHRLQSSQRPPAASSQCLRFCLITVTIWK